MNGPCVLSLGSLNVDFRARVDRWPAPRESLPARDIVASAGGRAGNVAAMVRKLGVACTLLGRVGCDRHAAIAVDPLVQSGVDVSHVVRVQHVPTGAGLVIVGPHGDKTMLFADYANADWRADDIAAIESVIPAAGPGSVLVADLDIPVAVAQAVARSCRARGITVVLDPSRPRTMQDALYALCDGITPDAREASALTGMAIASADDALRAASTLCRRGVRRAFVKLADGGCVVTDGSEAMHLVPPRVEPVDKTGAGDAFAGALACAMLEGQSTCDATRMAVAAAAIAVTREGTQSSYPGRPELEAMLVSVRVEPIGARGN